VKNFTIQAYRKRHSLSLSVLILFNFGDKNPENENGNSCHLNGILSFGF